MSHDSVNATIPAMGKIDIQIGAEKTITVDAAILEGYVIGRSDANSRYAPDLDLSQYDALERGVSRRHAVLVRYRDAVHVIDLASANGSFLNGERLTHDQPYPLSFGDQLRLGTLTLTFSRNQ